MTRLVIADDSDDIRMLVRLLVTADPEYKVVAEAATPEETIDAVREHKPDAIVLDQSFNTERTGLDIAPELRELSPATKILLFSAYQRLEGDATENDAVDAFLLKTKTTELLPTIQRLVNS